MFFFKKSWFFALAVLIVSGIGTHIFFQGRTSPEPIKIYRTTQPTPKQRPLQTDTPTITHDHSHDPPHDHASHDHIPDSTSQRETYDWRDDSNLEKIQMNEPWKNLNVQQTETDLEISDSEDSPIDPPQDWHLIEDPVLYTKYFRAQLIKQFGDRPEVHILADTTLKIRQNIPLTRDEYIADLEAQHALWPDPRTLRALEDVDKNGDTSFIRFEENPE